MNHKESGKFYRGDGFFCLGDIQKDLSWMVGYRREMYSKPQLTKSLRRLREGNMVETTKATRGVFITVCNYVKYQDPKEYEGNAEGSTKEPRKKRSGITKNKNDKNVKKETYGSFENVLLSEEEMTKLKDEFNGTLEKRIEDLSGYVASTGKKYVSHYATIKTWARKEQKEQPQPEAWDK